MGKSKNKKSKKSSTPLQISDERIIHKKSRNDIAPPLSKQESEHLTYMRVKAKYDEFSEKRVRYNKVGILFMIISAFVFLALMFSLETKIEFLTLWILTILICIAVLIRTDYRYNWYKELLGLADEFDKIEFDFDEEETKEGTSNLHKEEIKAVTCNKEEKAVENNGENNTNDSNTCSKKGETK